MIRKIATGLMLSAFAGALVIGCGKADLTQETAAWSKRAEEVGTKLAEVQQMHGSLMQMHTSWQVADGNDAEKAEYAKSGETLTAQETALADVSKVIADQAEAMKTAVATGDKAKFEEAWKAASAAYDDATAKLDGVASEQAAMKAKADAMMAAGAKGNDTAAAAGDAKPEGEMKAEGEKKMDDKKAEGAEKKAEGTEKKDEKKGM